MLPKIVLFYHNVVLRGPDVSTLVENEWLNDAILEFHMEYLERTTVPQAAGICLLRPAMVQLITHTSDPCQLVSVLPPRLKTQRAIFMPINDGRPCVANSGSHWSLLVYLQATRTFYYYDSLRLSNMASARLTAHQMALLLFLGDTAQLSVMSTPQQANGADCGAHVIGMTDLLVHRFLSVQGAAVDATALMHIDARVAFYPVQIRKDLQQLIRLLGNTGSSY
ncbi:hypothetical protein BDF14DRAFT_302405 [Spinellus fusiger]|nr:hypothetical protein BDF14DRAFT_302405 [Spinellus fusiger]